MIDINGRLHSTEKNVNVIAGADEILDDSKNKKQSEINTETYALVNDVNERLSGLSPDQQSALSVATKATNNEAKLSYYVCDTAAATAAKVIANATGYVLSVGGSIKIKMTNDNTADNATLNINSTGAKALYYAGERASAANTWEAGETVEVYYDGTSYYANNVAGGSGSGDGAFDVSAKYPTSGVEGGNTYTLDGALSVLNANLPARKKKGGMSIKFIQSSDNKYVQYFLTRDEWSTSEADWEKMNLEEEVSHLEKKAVISANPKEDDGADLDITDEEGNVLVRCNEGNIATKNFNSASIEESNLSPILKSKINSDGSKDLSVQTYNEGTADFYLSDNNGNVLLELEDGNIKTKNFDSSSTANKEVGFIPDILLKYHAIGDSITAGAGTSVGNRYFELLVPWCKFTSITSDGAGGRELQSFGGCLSNIPSTTELVSFFGGTNDWGHHKQLGTISSTVGASNFYGQVKYLCDWMQKNKPNVRFFFICPLKRDNNKFPADGCPEGQDTNNLGKKLDDYVNAIKEVCEMYKVPYIDLFSGKNSFDFTNYMGDGLHPSADGHALLAFQIQKLINYKL